MTQRIGLEAVFEDKAFQSGVDRYNRSIDDMVGRTTSGAASMGSQFAGLGTKVLGVAGLLGGALVAGAGAAGVAMASFVADGVQQAMSLEAQLDGIQAVLGASADEIANLGDLIINLGLNPNLKVTATEAADAIDMLARNGLSATEILNGAAEATVLLANATGADFATSANIATDTMAIFNIEAENMIEAVNGITSVTAGSKFDMNDYALALAQAGGVAASSGVEFNDFNTTIAAISPLFASGSDAGTSFKTMLQRLIPTSDKAEDLMRDLGLITDETGNIFFDSEGNLKSMNEIAVILNETLAGMTEEQRNAALSTLFGTDAMRAAVGVMDSGAIAYTDAATAAEELGVTIDEANAFIDGGITKYEALMLQMQQTDAVESAATRMDNLAGALEILGGIVDAVKLQVGNAFLPVLQELVETVGAFISENQEAIVGFFTSIATGISEFVTSVSEGQSPIQAFFDALAAAGVDEETITQIQGIVDKVQEFITTIVEFVTEHAEAFKGAIIGIGAVLAGSAIVAIISGIIAALTALATPVTAIIAGAALLGAAWSENWFGIRDTLTQVWTDLQPTLETIREWLETNIPIAIETVTTAFGKVSSWFNDNKAAIQDFADNTIGKVAAAWEQTGDTLSGVFSEQFEKVSAWFTENKPLIEDFAQVIGTVLGAAILGLIKVWSILQVQLARFVELVGAPIFDALVTNFLNVATLIMQIVTGDWAGAWESVKTIVTDQLAALGETLSGFVDFIAGWFGSSGAEIASIWAGIWDNLVFIVTAVWEIIKTAVSDAWTSIVTWFTGVVTGFTEGWQAFWDGLFLTVSTIWAAIITYITDAITGFVAGWNAFWDGLFLTVSTIWLAIQTFITEGIANFIAGWTAFWDSIKATVDAIWLGIKTFIMDTITGLFASMGLSLDEMSARWSAIWTDVQLIVQTVWEMIKTWIETKVTEVQTVITTIITAIQEWWDTTWTAISMTAQMIWDAITTYISTKITEAQTILTTILAAIQTWWDTTWTAISTTAQTIWDAITTYISTKITEAQMTITTIVTAIQTWWSTTWTAISTAAQTIWNTIVTYISTKITEAQTAIETVVSAVQTWWDERWAEIRDTLQNIWDEIHTAIETKLNEIKQIIEDKITEAKNWIGDQVEGFKSVGTDIITGVKNGILAAAGQVIEAVVGIVEDAVAAAKAFLGIESPSKVFAAIGTDTIAGLIEGILASTADLEGVMGEAIGPILDFGNKLGSFGGAMASRFKSEVLDPMKANLQGLEDEVSSREGMLDTFVQGWAEQLGMTAEELRMNLPNLTLAAATGGDTQFLRNLETFRQLQGEINESQGELNTATREYEAQQERLLQLEKQRQDLAFLQQQLDFLAMIQEAGLDPAEILGGLELGLNADLPGLIDAMSNAMSAIVNAANNELQIASPSKVFQKIGKQMLDGLALGLDKVGPVVAAMGSVADTVVNTAVEGMKAIANSADLVYPTLTRAIGYNKQITPLQNSRPQTQAPVVNVDAAAPQYNATFNTRQNDVTLSRAFRLLELSHAS